MTRLPALAFRLALGCANAAPPQPAPVDAAWLATQKIPAIGTVVGAQLIDDRDGAHVLVLARQAVPRSGRVEHIELRATLYGSTGARWTPEWTIHDLVDCPQLDAAADFFPQAVTFTDLNNDGCAETTVA
jgi:hypothetical protein